MKDPTDKITNEINFSRIGQRQDNSSELGFWRCNCGMKNYTSRNFCGKCSEKRSEHSSQGIIK